VTSMYALLLNTMACDNFNNFFDTFEVDRGRSVNKESRNTRLKFWNTPQGSRYSTNWFYLSQFSQLSEFWSIPNLTIFFCGFLLAFEWSEVSQKKMSWEGEASLLIKKLELSCKFRCDQIALNLVTHCCGT
jgi:hypothetical protein